MSDKVPVRYVGPSRRPQVIAATGDVVCRGDAPASSWTPDDNGEVPVEVAWLPADVAGRLLRQSTWRRADPPAPPADADGAGVGEGEPEPATPDDLHLYLPATDAGLTTHHQED
jgi:hypothetical protein